MSRRGFVLVELMIAIAIVAIIAAIAIPNLIQARKGANEASAIGSLRTIASSQELFRVTDKDANGILDYASSLGKLHDFGLIDGTLAGGTKSGYLFTLLVAGVSTWSARADPIGTAGDRSFFVDETGMIRFALGAGSANASSTPIGE